MNIIRYLMHILTLLAKRKKPLIVVTVWILCSFIFFKDIQNIFSNPKNQTFNQSLFYCNKPHHVDGQENSLSENFNLRQIQVLIRHGDRAPIDLKALPNIAPVYISCMFNKTEDYFLNELNRYREVARRNIFYLHGNQYDRLLDERVICRGGQLTPYGFLQHLYLGRYLKKSYGEFFDNVDLFEDIWIQSTNVQRTIQSAAALMTGIFYDRFKNVSPENKIGINIFQDKISDSHFLLDHDLKDLDCAPLKLKLKRRTLNRTRYSYYKDYAYLLHSFSEVLSVSRKHIPPVNRIADVLYTKLCHGQGIPYGPHAKIPSRLVEKTFRNADQYFSEKSADAAELQTLSLLSQIALNWYKLANSKDSNDFKKLILYSGHDSMITPFLILLGVNDGKWPPYASRVIFEFYEKKIKVLEDNEIYFRVLFNGKVMKDLRFCNTPVGSHGDDGLCHMKDMFQYVSNNRYTSDSNVEFHPSILFERIRKMCLK